MTTEFSLTLSARRLNLLTQKKEEGNTIDMRMYVNGDFKILAIPTEDGINALYQCVKNEPNEWFIDFYENIQGANFAEFIDVCLWKDECTNFDDEIAHLKTLAKIHTLETFVEYIKSKYPIRETYNIIDFDCNYFVGTINLTEKWLSGDFEVWDKECCDTICIIRTANTRFKEDTTALNKWKKASENAITLWNTKDEEVKVEITSKYVKFFRRDDILSCYTYPPLHELKKDSKCIKELKDTMYESCMWEELKALKTWENNDCDMPPFPISVIFHSDYQGYEFKEWE